MTEQPGNYLPSEKEAGDRLPLTIKLPVAIAARLEKEAKRRGVSPEALATEFLAERLGV